MRPEDWIRERAAVLKGLSQWREPGEAAGERVPDGGAALRVDARSNDYLGLAESVVSRETLGQGVAAGAGASRLISGTRPEHLELEARLAEWLAAEATLLFSSGYAANVGVVSAVAGPGDVVLSDALNHASLIDGCRLGRARVVVVPHLDLTAMEQALAESGAAPARWVVTESYFGMDGDVPDLRALRALCDSHGAGLIVDEAHALGVFGVEGRGLCSEAGVVPDLLIGGMGKGLGVQGGFAAGSSGFRGWLWNRARTFVFSTAPSPAICRVALQQLHRLREADGARRRLHELERRLERQLELGSVPLRPGRRGPLFPIVFGEERQTLAAAASLRRLGVAVHAIRPPTVPPGGSRLRVTLRADMSDEDVERLGAALVEVWRSNQPKASLSRGPSDDALAPPPNHRATAPETAVPPETAQRAAAPPHVATARCGVVAESAAEHAAAGMSPSPVAGTPPPPDAAVRPSGTSPPRAAAAAAGTSPPNPAARAPSVALPVAAPGSAPTGSGTASSVAGSEERSLGPSPRTGQRVSAAAPRWVVLGTGTDVGKSFVAEALVRAIAARGRPVAGLKPVETGLARLGDAGAGGDAARLQQASFHVKHPQPHPLFGYRDPLTPSLAARRASSRVELERVLPWLEQVQVEGSEQPPALIIETAGGVFSPLNDRQDNLDLAVALGPAEWILVAPDRLGALHDVLSTLRAMESVQRAPDWLILSAVREPDASSGTNAAELRRRNIKPPIILLRAYETAPLEAIVERHYPGATPRAH